MASQKCPHLDQVREVEPLTPNGCEECLKMHSTWVHLRLCLECGHVGCCDSSPNKHATKHFHQTSLWRLARDTVDRSAGPRVLCGIPRSAQGARYRCEDKRSSG